MTDTLQPGWIPEPWIPPSRRACRDCTKLRRIRHPTASGYGYTTDRFAKCPACTQEAKAQERQAEEAEAEEINASYVPLTGQREMMWLHWKAEREADQTRPRRRYSLNPI